MKKRSSLESRLCLLITGLLFALLLAVAHVQMVGQRAALLAERTQRYEILSKLLPLIYNPVSHESDWALCEKITQQFMNTDKDISYVVITDSQGRVLFGQARDVEEHRYKNLVGKQAARFMNLVGALSFSEARDPIRISVPALVKPKERGTISIAFGSRTLDAAAEEMETKLTITFVLAFMVGLIGAMLLARTIALLLRQLISAARAVEAGNLDVTVSVSSNDEIGELSETFNRMTAALKESRDKLIERANSDSLTGLYNHRYFQERLRSEIRRAERYKRPLTVIMLDIDHFKTLNDTHGHPIGDIVLQEVARILITKSRNEIDIVARYGGEEFAIILPECEASEGFSVAERLREAVQHHHFVDKNDVSIPVTISLGVAQYPLHSSEPEGLVMAADLAMYQSKSMGRNRSSLFNADVQTNKQSDPYRLYLLLHAADMSTIEAMAAAIDAKVQRKPGYFKAVVTHAVALAEEIGLSAKEQHHIRLGCLLHDIGNLGISDKVLNKRGPLTEEEWNTIKSHPSLGYSVVQKSPYLKAMIPGILYHHERWDGTGYPDGLRGDQIPMIARIISVVDAYHAMISDRRYRPALEVSQAIEELRRNAGTQFDPNIVEAFIRVLERENNAIENAA